MSTVTGVVFFADNQGFFEAADATTGKSLWHFNTGQSLHASPMSYAVGGNAIRSHRIRQRPIQLRLAPIGKLQIPHGYAAVG